MRRAATAIGALAIVATLATACGSSGSDDAKPEATTTTVAEAKATTTTTTDPNAPTEAQLETALLTAAEMGSEWSVAASDDDSEPGCLTPLSEDGTIPGPKVETQFTATAAGGQEVAVFEGLAYAGSDSEAAFAAVKTALDSCTEVSSSGTGPQSLTPATFPSVGVDTAAWTATFETGGQTLQASLVASLQSNVVVLVMGVYSDGQDFPTEAMQPIIQGAVDKVEQTLDA